MCHSSTIKNYDDEGGSSPAPSWLVAKRSRVQIRWLDTNAKPAVAVKILVVPARCYAVQTTQYYPVFNYCNANPNK